MAMASVRLKIAVLHRTFRRDAGGAEAYAVAIALELSASHDVHVFTQEMDNTLDAVTYHPIPLFFKRPRWLNQLWFALATWWLTRHGFDIVHYMKTLGMDRYKLFMSCPCVANPLNI